MYLDQNDEETEAERVLKSFAKIQAGMEIFLVNQLKERGWEPDRAAIKDTMEHLISGVSIDPVNKTKVQVLIEFLKADEHVLTTFCTAIRIKIKNMMQGGIGGEGFKITKNLKQYGIRAVFIDSETATPEQFFQVANDFILYVNIIDAHAVKIDEGWARQQWHGYIAEVAESIGDMVTVAGGRSTQLSVKQKGVPGSIGDMVTIAGGRSTQLSVKQKGVPGSIGDMVTISPHGESPDIVLLPDSMGKRYELLELLGEGGFGQVFKAWDKLLNRDVALKSFKPDVLTERSLREAQAAAQLNHHSIVHVYDFIQQDGRLFIVMEYVNGSSLREVLQKRGDLSLSESLRIINLLCEAMSVAHSFGIVHRDIKPENILCSIDLTTIKIVDFGLARIEDATSFSVTGEMVGTILYMAPEQFSDAKHVDHRVDIFAIGKVLYEMLTGDLPVLIELDRLPSVPLLRQLVEQCVRTDPKERIKNTAEILSLLQKIKK